MRARQQIELSPGEYVDAKRRERQRILAELLRDLTRAREQNAPWYQWIVWRQNRVHKHGLRNEKSEPIACPVPGCDDGHSK